jgi:hypothetical protein
MTTPNQIPVLDIRSALEAHAMADLDIAALRKRIWARLDAAEERDSLRAAAEIGERIDATHMDRMVEIASLREERDRLRTQRDELLAALEPIVWQLESAQRSTAPAFFKGFAMNDTESGALLRAIAAAKETTNALLSPLAVASPLGSPLDDESARLLDAAEHGDGVLVGHGVSLAAAMAARKASPKHEAKIAAWRDIYWSARSSGGMTLDDTREWIDEGVALMRSAPDGDAKLAEVRRLRHLLQDACAIVCWRRDGGMWTTAWQEMQEALLVDAASMGCAASGVRSPKPEPPAPQDGDAKLRELRAEIDRLRAENARLQADLAAAVKAHQFAESSQKVEQGLAKSAEARVAHLERDLAAARADQAAMARRELEAVQSWMFQFRPAGYPNIQAVASFCTDRLAALPAQHAEPKPDAATRDGDEVLRELAQWAGGEGTNELWRAVAELCRRELARGGK